MIDDTELKFLDLMERGVKALETLASPPSASPAAILGIANDDEVRAEVQAALDRSSSVTTSPDLHDYLLLVAFARQCLEAAAPESSVDSTT